MVSKLRVTLLVSSAIAGVGLSFLPNGPAAAAEGAAAAPAAPDQIAEVVVTATRREDTISRVPLSVTALTQEALSDRAVRNIEDLRRLTPGLGLNLAGNAGGTTTSGDSNISLRGISSLTGAATTGVYIDDVPVHKTQLLGAGFGAAYPKLFDLERVEVLRGPQGTLFGSSTEGGAVRFITPQPSLSQMSGFVRTELSDTQHGQGSYEAGAAIGGPIVKDRIGFRVSVWGRRDGGWIDHVSRFTGKTLATDTNDQEAYLIRAAATFAVTDNLRITPSFLLQSDIRDDADHYWKNTPAINAPAVGFTATGANCNLATTTCARVLPAHTYGPYDMFGPGRSGLQRIFPATGVETPVLTPRKETMYLPALAIDYDLGFADLHSVTGYVSDRVKGSFDVAYRMNPPGLINNYPANEIFVFPERWAEAPFFNHKRTISQEVRLASKGDARPLTWLVGGFYSYAKFAYNHTAYTNYPAEILAVRGVTFETFYGFPPLRADLYRVFDQGLTERNISGFGEVNYWITDRLKATAGARVSRDKLYYFSATAGDAARGAAVATRENGGFFDNAQASTTITPKFGISYQVTDRNLVYATAAKGYRQGGFNSPSQFSNLACAASLATLNISAPDSAYGPDTVWSYEGGAKLGLMGGRLRVNSSAYYVDWKNIQTSLNIPGCGQYTANAAKAVSKGFDIQVEARPIEGLTLSGSVGYTHARFTEAVTQPTVTGGRQLVIGKGDHIIGVPDWQITAGARYDFPLGGKYSGYVLADYTYGSAQYTSTGPGTSSYAPDVYRIPPIDFVTARAGIHLSEDLEVAIFAKNLTNSKDDVLRFGGSNAVRNSPVIFAQTFRPREIGMNLEYRF